MNRVLAVMFLLCGVRMAGAAALDETVLKHESVSRLVEQKCIVLTAEGTADIAFQDAGTLLGRADLLTLIQQGYAATLPEGKQPEFAVSELAAGKYQYVNRHGQRTYIEEAGRKTVAGDKVLLAFYSAGCRFFGEYRSVCQVEVVPLDAGRVAWSVLVYARPDSAAVRLFAKLTPVETFFRRKTRELTGLTVQVCDWIVKQQYPAAEGELARSVRTAGREGERL